MTEQSIALTLSSTNEKQIVELLNAMIEDQNDPTDGHLFMAIFSTTKRNRALLKAINLCDAKPSELFQILNKKVFAVRGDQNFAEYLNHIISTEFQPASMKAKALDFFIEYAIQNGNGIKIEFVKDNLIKGYKVDSVKKYIQYKLRNETIENPYQYLEI
jgi:hypothetical protein